MGGAPSADVLGYVDGRALYAQCIAFTGRHIDEMQGVGRTVKALVLHNDEGATASLPTQGSSPATSSLQLHLCDAPGGLGADE